MASKAKKQAAPPSPAMVKIEKRAEVLAEARASMATIIAKIKQDSAEITKAELPEIRRLSAEIGVAHESLMQLLKDNAGLFESPRSVAFHGIKVGYVKGKGKLIADNPERIIKRIEAQLPEQLDTLAPSGRTLSLQAIGALDTKTIRALGVTIVAATDAPFIKTPADDLDKFVATLTGAHIDAAAED